MPRLPLGILFLLVACPSDDAPSITAPTRETHQRHFPIAAGPHASADCNDCHGAFDTFTRFDCLGCHTRPGTDPRHASVAGYAWESPRCYGCHPTGEAAIVDHSPYFPIEPPAKHAGLACAECHPVAGDRKQVECNACHAHPASSMGSAHGRVGGYDPASALCLRCHADAQVHRVSSHLPFRIDEGAEHFRVNCLACHPESRADKPWATDFARARVDCLGCHSRSEMDAEHAGRPGYQYQSLSCIQGGCHANGDSPGD